MVVKRRVSFSVSCSEIGKELEHFKRVQKVSMQMTTKASGENAILSFEASRDWETKLNTHLKL